MRKITLLNTTKEVGYSLLERYGCVQNILDIVAPSKEVTFVPDLDHVLAKLTVVAYEDGVLIVSNEMDLFKIEYYLMQFTGWKVRSRDSNYSLLSKGGYSLFIKIKGSDIK